MITRRTFLAFLALAGAASAQIPLLDVQSAYRVVDLQPENHGVGVALLDADPKVEQNFCFFTLDTKVYLDIIRKDGSKKTFPANLDKFWKRVKVGDIIKVKAGRAWDGQIQAEQVWLEHHGEDPVD